jgi:hypothetical protein
MFKDDITGKPLVVSNKSTQTIIHALVAAHNAGVIGDYEYAMTYAEVCEIGRLPQMFGGGPVDRNMMHEWQNAKSWS